MTDELPNDPPMSGADRLQSLIDSADTDANCVSMLREIVRRSANSAPVEALKEIAQALVTIRRRDSMTEAEKN